MKVKYLFAGAGTISGVPAACYGGYCIYDAALPTYAKQFTDFGHTLTLIDASKLSLEKFNDGDQWKIETNGCFSRLFSKDVTISQEKENKTNDIISYSITSKEEEGVAIGCMLANFKYTSDHEFTFRSSITVKNDKFGWAVWTYNKKSSTGSGGSTDTSSCTPSSGKNDYVQWAYKILFLERTLPVDESSGSKGWSVKGGYYLADCSYYTNTTSSPISIKLPGMESSLIEGKADKTYAGIWTTTSTGGEDVFEGVKFSYGSNPAWLGRPVTSGNKFNDSDFKVVAYYDSKWYLKCDGSDWGSKHNELNQLFAPFKDKKGSWQTDKEYCAYLGSYRSLSDTDKERLKDLCYNTTADNSPS